MVRRHVVCVGMIERDGAALCLLLLCESLVRSFGSVSFESDWASEYADVSYAWLSFECFEERCCCFALVIGETFRAKSVENVRSVDYGVAEEMISDRLSTLV